MRRDDIPSETYTKLLKLRTALRHFERASERRAREAGMTVARHQLLLAIRGHDDERGPTIGDVASYLLIRHHSVVGLVDRAEAAGLVRRRRDPDDHRMVRLAITDEAADRLASISAQNVAELQQLTFFMPDVERGFGLPAPATATATIDCERPVVRAAHVDDRPFPVGCRVVLVDRLWPRGVAKSDLAITLWMRDVAPSTSLRQWFGHEPVRFDEFRRRYVAELSQGEAALALADLRSLARSHDVTIVTSAREVEMSSAAVLRDIVAGES